MQALVTGATGFLGSHVARRLVEEGHDVRALVRGTSDTTLIDDLDVETVVGDVTDPSTLPPTVDGCDAVFHAAGVVSFWPGWRERLEAVNVRGVEHVIEAAIGADVDRLVHTSSVAAVGRPPEGTVADESMDFVWDGPTSPYVETKHAGEEIVREAARKGRIDAVAVNPGTVLGPGDLNKNGGQIVREAARAGFPGVPDGGTSFVDVRDVAEGHLRAHRKGRTGERYILGAENLSFAELFAIVGEETPADPPEGRFPYWAAMAYAYWSELRSRFSGRHPRLPVAAARELFRETYYSSKKAEEELGFDPRPVREAVADTYDWYVEQGML